MLGGTKIVMINGFQVAEESFFGELVSCLSNFHFVPTLHEPFPKVKTEPRNGSACRRCNVGGERNKR